MRECKPISSLLQFVALKTPHVVHLVSDGYYKTCPLLSELSLLPQMDGEVGSCRRQESWVAAREQGSSRKPESLAAALQTL